MNGFYNKCIHLFREKKSGVFLFVGIAGMALILISTILPSEKKENPSVGAGDVTAQEYVAQMETRLTGLVGKIDGVGKCEVMVTAENEAEYVYAVEESQNVNETNSFSGDTMQRQTQQQNIEEKYIVLDAGGGKKEALLKTRRQPTVQGVVIVCEGAADPRVCERVTQAVTTALGIPYTRVCVIKLDESD